MAELQPAPLPPPIAPPSKRRGEWLPGVALTVALAAVGYGISGLPILKVIGTLCVTLLLGMALRAAVGVPRGTAAGIKLSAKTLLRLGIVLMGARLNYGLIVTAGPKVLAIDVAVIVASIGGLTWLARRFGLPRELSILMGFGTGICGASAVIAAATVARADEEATTLAVALMGILGTLGVFFYMAVGPLLGLRPEVLGVLVGSTLHEVAQVIAGASPWGAACLDMATMVKLTRVVMLAPALLAAGYVFNRGLEGGRVRYSWKEPPIPWFVVGFLLVGLLNSLHWLVAPVQEGLVKGSIFLMAVAMGGMGLNTDFAMIRKTGWGAIAAGLLGFLAIFALSLGLITLLGVA